MRIPLILFFSLWAIFSVKAADDAFTLDLVNTGVPQPAPAWMSGPPSALPGTHATISFPITPPRDDSDLAVTFYFTETPGGFLRVYWAGVQASEMLSDNLYEGIGMPNQRTLLIKRSTLSSPGTLSVQSSETTLNISHIHWEWVDRGAVSLANSMKQASLVNATGNILGEEDVDGSPTLPKPDLVGKTVVTANLTDRPERIETGVEFLATLQGIPQYARVEVQMSGVPIDKPVHLWVNGALAGEVSMELPDLNDPGYQSVPGATPVYIGWRKGVIYLTAGQLKVGDNRFQFDVKDATTATPLAVKDLLLQLKYGDQPAATDTDTAIPAVSTPLAIPSPSPTPAPEELPDTSLIFYRFNGGATLR